MMTAIILAKNTYRMECQQTPPAKLFVNLSNLNYITMYLFLFVNASGKYVVQPWASEWLQATPIFSWPNYEIFLSRYPC